MNKQLNWLTITASGLFALLLVNSAQAVEYGSITPKSTSPTVAESSSSSLIASRRKKHRKQKVRRTIRKTVTRTSIRSSIGSFNRTTTTTTTVITAPANQPFEPIPSTIPAPPPVEVIPPFDTPAASAPIPQTIPSPPPIDAPQATEAPKPSVLSQFSTNTKLQGQVIFGATGTVNGDFSRNTAFGHRTRIELKTNIAESGVLTTRLQAVGLGLSNLNPTSPGTTATPDGSLSWTDGTTTSSVGIDALKYEFPLGSQTQVVAVANAGAADDFADTINPYFDGDGASGSISAFGNRPSIYYTVQGAGVGVRHKLSDTTELSVGYLARNANSPAAGNGLFAGGYGALAQLTFKTAENSKVGVTYTRSFNSDPGTGSTNANGGGLSDNIGVQGSFQLNPQLALGGWAGYTQNQATGGDRQIWNWAVTAAAPNFGGEGNLAGLLVGQSPKVGSSSNGTTDTQSGLHIEGFYQIKVNDNLSITPGLIYLTRPDHNENNAGAVIGALRTTFTF